eukprot:gene8007-12472_t
MSLFVVYSFVMATDEKWNTLYRRDVPVDPQKSVGFGYNSRADRIKYKVHCSEKCNVYLMNYDEFENLKNKKPFKFLKADMNTIKSYNEFSDEEEIARNLYVVVVNENEKQIKATLFLSQYFQADFFFNIVMMVVLQSVIVCCVILTGFACLFGAVTTIRDRVIVKEIRNPNPIYPSAH